MACLRIAVGVAALAAALCCPAAVAGDRDGDGASWPALSDGELDGLRGGFAGPAGVLVSFGIVRTVNLQGVVSRSSLHIDDLRSITALQAAQLAREGQVVIQNRLDNQSIQSVTEINATTNGASLLRGLNLQQTLNNAIGAAARP